MKERMKDIRNSYKKQKADNDELPINRKDKDNIKNFDKGVENDFEDDSLIIEIEEIPDEKKH